MFESTVRSRRSFVQTSTAAAVLAHGAVQSGTVRFGVRTPLEGKTLRDRAHLLRDLGYEGIELGPEWLNQPAPAILDELRPADISVSAIVGSLKLLDTDARARADATELDSRRLIMAKELGAYGVIEVPVFGPNRFQDLSPLLTPQQIEERLLVAALKQLAPDVRRTGVKVLLEPIARRWTHFMIMQGEGARIIDAVGAPGFELLTDFFHMQLEERNVTETLEAYAKYTGYVHLADGAKRTEPGSLPFDYRPGFSALKKRGFSGWLTMECDASDSPRPALSRALKYVKQQWADA